MGQECYMRLLIPSFFPIFFVPGLMLGTGDIERNQLSHGHGRPEGQDDKGKGHWRNPEETLQEKVS